MLHVVLSEICNMNINSQMLNSNSLISRLTRLKRKADSVALSAGDIVQELEVMLSDPSLLGKGS